MGVTRRVIEGTHCPQCKRIDCGCLMVAKIDVKLAPEPEVVTTARHTLDRLANLLPSEKLEDVRLVVSELVTNSIHHAGLSPDDQSGLR